MQNKNIAWCVVNAPTAAASHSSLLCILHVNSLMSKYVVNISSWSVACVSFTDICQAGCCHALNPADFPLEIYFTAA